MGAERRNYVMPVGLALQREMAYRKKLQRLSAEHSLKKYPLLSQVPNPSSSQVSRTTSAVIPYSGLPHPYFSGRPGQAPLPKLNTWYHEPVAGSMPLVRPHFSKRKPNSGPSSSAGQKRKRPVQGEQYFCDLCQVDCDNPFNLKMHLKGLKHKAKLAEAMGIAIETAHERGPSNTFHCDLCGICCTGEFSFRQHLNGKHHNAKLNACGNDTNGDDGETAMNYVHSS